MNFFLHTNYSQRPTVYNHMQPVERIASYIIGMIERCQVDIKGLDEERAMWNTAQAQKVLGLDECMVLCDQAASLRQSLESELAKWLERLAKLGICGTCLGRKEIKSSCCEDCEGTGRILAKLPLEVKPPVEVGPPAGANFLTMVARKFK